MAGLDSILSSLLQTVSQILINETKTILNASADVKLLEGELKFMQEFLRCSERERNEVKEVVKQIQVAALEAENIIDDFVRKMEKHKRRNPLLKFVHGGDQIKLLSNAAAKVKQIRKTIDGINANRDKYNITSGNDAANSKKSTIQSRRRHVEMEDVVCFENQAKLVMEMLDTWYSQREVVSIIGMGGLGKTTLARKIYNCDFMNNFECAAWVDVSQAYNLKDLLKKIANAVLPSIEMVEFNKQELLLTTEEGEEKLVQKLKIGLESKRYFIVLDDVWENLLWNEIKAAFPENGKRSRVLITSRVKEVALHASTHTEPYLLPFLDEDESWKLLSRKAFHDQVCLPDQEEFIRKEFLSKCKGLPLAIVVVAGLLKTRDQLMWPKIAKDLERYIDKDPRECFAILALSYEELPPRLKPCFLYLGVYPEDFKIPVKQLIRLWVAEGFLDEDNYSNSDMEDVAEEYLLELIDRSLIQVASKTIRGRVKTCRIHDLLRDLAISEGEKEMFLSVDKKLEEGALQGTQPRRLSVQYGSRDLRYNYLTKFSQLRSLLSFGVRDRDPVEPNNILDSGRYYNTAPIAPNKDPLNQVSKFCRYLRVLEMGDSGRKFNFPPKVEKLVQLRYLRMKAADINELPSSISKLVNLQVLDFEITFAMKLRLNPWEMRQLRHLNLYYKTRVSIPEGNGITELPNLRTLSWFRLESEDDGEIIKRFPNLKKLKVECEKDDLGVFEYLSKLQRLQTLSIYKKFRLTDPGALPLSLTKISLRNTNLDTSVLSKLGGLPNLQVLKLDRSFNDGERKLETVSSDQGQFPRLQFLFIFGLKIEEWSMEGQGFQSLVHLSIDNCKKLKAIPDQLKQLTSLRQLKIGGSRALKKSLKQTWVNDERLIISYC